MTTKKTKGKSKTAKKTTKKAVKKTAKKTAPKKGKKAAKKAATRAKKAATRAKKASKKVVTTTTTTTTVVTTTTTKVNPKETHYLLILDESGSMGSVRKETLSGLNEQIKTIKNLDNKYPDQDYFVSIVKFDDEIVTLFEDVPAAKVRELKDEDYRPDAMTALYDAIGVGVTRLKNKINNKLTTGEASALVVILTDGHENASDEWKDKSNYSDPASKIRALITELEKSGLWTFTFIGANQDAVLTAKALGVNVNNTVNYTSSGIGTGLAFASVGSAMMKRAAYTDAGVYAATTDNFMSEVTRGFADLGEDASALDLSGKVSDEDIKKAKDALDKKNSNSTDNSSK